MRTEPIRTRSWDALGAETGPSGGPFHVALGDRLPSTPGFPTGDLLASERLGSSCAQWQSPLPRVPLSTEPAAAKTASWNQGPWSTLRTPGTGAPWSVRAQGPENCLQSHWKQVGCWFLFRVILLANTKNLPR